MSLPPGAQRIRDAFGTRDGRRPLLVAYLMAGHPDDALSLEAARAALDAGADMLEIGVPFSDPVADGPVVEAAGHATVASGGGLDSGVRLADGLRSAGYAQPLLAMGYLNPIVAAGTAATLARLRAAGIDGLILPDLPVGEDPQFERDVAAAGLALTFLATPNTPPRRLQRAIERSSGFVYVVPLYGVTGVRDAIADRAIPFLREVREQVGGRTPVGIGFGISQPEHVQALAPETDAIIVGSAVVAALRDGGPAGVATLVRALAGAR